MVVFVGVGFKGDESSLGKSDDITMAYKEH